jgi:Zn-dependent M28 family amino/carboxypeptidase
MIVRLIRPLRLAHVLHRALLLAAVIAPALTARVVQTHAQPPLPDVAARITPDQLTAHVRALSVTIGARRAGGEAEARAAAYVADQFASWGYTVETRPFALSGANTSQNVIAVRPATHPGPDSRAIVIGAHLDCVTDGTGADDNGSGVAVMLAAAEALADLDTVHTLVFVAFGSEEIGQRGSRAYVDGLSDADVADILVMFNVDTVGIGDTFYVYAGAITQGQTFAKPYTPGPTWPRDLALAAGESLGHAVQTSPADGWNGFTGPWSDHYPFLLRGVPVAYFERWNWDAGQNRAWGQETAEGDYLHTPRDVFDNVDPARMEPVAETLALVTAQLAAGIVTP